MIKKICSLSLLKRISVDDPVRPGISAEDRIAAAREVYHLNNKAYICLAYLDTVPDSEHALLNIECGPIVVAYTIWSTEKGRGRDLILAIRDMISAADRFERLVTLSPKTDMAMKFHLSNGAELIHENMTTNNFEYKI
tara:strand:+ start:1682 stop:2095 length:414 start_codon:yes stop_codon:yes gene_type:complete